MPIWSAVGPRGADRPIALINDKGLRIGDPPGPELELPLDTWTSDRHDVSLARFNSLKIHGIQREHKRHGIDRPYEGWRFRGAPYYLDQQGERLGVCKVLTDRASRNQEIHRISTLIGQVNERYHSSRKDENGIPVVSGMDRASIGGTLAQCEEELVRLHVLAAASRAIIDRAHTECGTEIPVRHFRIVCDFDEPTDVAEPEELADSVPASHLKHQNATPAKAK